MQVISPFNAFQIAHALSIFSADLYARASISTIFLSVNYCQSKLHAVNQSVERRSFLSSIVCWPRTLYLKFALIFERARIRFIFIYFFCPSITAVNQNRTPSINRSNAGHFSVQFFFFFRFINAKLFMRQNAAERN